MRSPLNKLFPVLAGLLIVVRLPAGTFHTITSGTWSSAITWLNGQIPPLSGTDTIYVHHHVMYTYPIALPSSTELIIDTTGSLCGHERFHIQNSSNLVNNGNFYADTLIINGGHLFNNNFVQLTNMAAVTNGGGIVNNGSIWIGAPFLCNEKPNSIEENSTGNYNIYPNPAVSGQEIHLDNLPGNCELLIIDLQGNIICRVNAEQVIPTSGMCPGVYFIEGKAGDILFHRKIIIAE